MCFAVLGVGATDTTSSIHYPRSIARTLERMGVALSGVDTPNFVVVEPELVILTRISLAVLVVTLALFVVVPLAKRRWQVAEGS